MRMPYTQGKYMDESQSLVTTNKTKALKDTGQSCDQEGKEPSQDYNSIFASLGLDLFRNRQFTLGNIASVLVIMPHFVVPSILPDHILWFGGTSQQATDTLIVIGIANMLSRMFNWNISGQSTKTWLLILGISSISSGVSLISSWLYTQYWMYIILCIWFGILRGIYVIYYYMLLVTIVGKDRVHHGVGIMYTAWGIGILIGLSSSGGIANMTLEQYGYNFVLMLMGGTEVLGGFIFLLMGKMQSNME